MNSKAVLHMAKILALSSVRARSTKGGVPKGRAKSPRMNIIVSVAGFPVAAFLSYSLANAFLEDIILPLLLVQFAVFVPSVMVMAAIMYGLLFEFSQSAYVGSTDIINWLPIGAMEYVLASALSMTYFLAPVFAVLFGATLGLALSVNMLDVWMFSLVSGMLGMFLGVFIIEILRALTNRVSATFYKRSGRSTVAVRMLVSISLMVAFILFFNINVLLRLLEYFVGGVGNAWFIPLLWPSLAIVNYLAADTLQTIIYSILSVGFTLAFLLISVRIRTRYWVPTPVTIKLAPSKPYTPRRGILGRLGFTAAETALVRKDWRGLTRRKEMMTWIAMPVAISIIFLITSQSSWSAATITFEKLTFFWGPSMGIFMFAFYLTLTGIGQEGSAFINLLATPLKEKEITKAKLAAALLPAACALAVLLVFINRMVQPRLEVLIAIIVALSFVLLECALVGVVVGSRFPDFTEAPRARFVTASGTLLGMIMLSVSAGATLLPLFLYGIRILGAFPLSVATTLTAITGAAVSYAVYRAAVSGIRRLLDQTS